jgi:DNA-binding NarL/FixJ family response regulator
MGASRPQVDPSVSCILVDDHPAVIAALSDLLESEGIAVVGHAADAAEALALERAPATVVVSDLRLPGRTGIELAHDLLEADPECRVVLYTATISPAGAVNALRAGIRGVVLKDSIPAELSRAVRTVAEGGTFVDPRLAG